MHNELNQQQCWSGKESSLLSVRIASAKHSMTYCERLFVSLVFMYAH